MISAYNKIYRKEMIKMHADQIEFTWNIKVSGHVVYDFSFKFEFNGIERGILQIDLDDSHFFYNDAGIFELYRENTFIGLCKIENIKRDYFYEEIIFTISKGDK